MRFVSLYQRTFAAVQATLVQSPVIIFSDLDYTLTFPKGGDDFDLVLPNVFKATFDSLKQTGVMFVPSSARSMGEIEEAIKDCQCDAMVANDGCVISISGEEERVYYGGLTPDYEQFEKDVAEFIAYFPGIRYKKMGMYFTLFVGKDHPARMSCESFFASEVAAVSARSQGMPIIFESWATTISLGPRDKRGKAGAIEYLMPILLEKHRAQFPDRTGPPVVICAGDGANDKAALELVKTKYGGHAMYVRDGVMRGCPAFATVELHSPLEWMETLMSIAKCRIWKAAQSKLEFQQRDLVH